MIKESERVLRIKASEGEFIEEDRVNRLSGWFDRCTMRFECMLERLMPIIPTTKCLFLCDGYTPVEAGKITLHGLFHTIKALDGFPFIKDEFCVYLEMGNGLGTLPIRLEIRSALSDELIHESKEMQLTFKDRNSVLQVVVRIQKCCFEQPGEYILNLICNNRWLGDTVIQVR